MHVSYFADGNKRLHDEEIRSIKERENKVKRTLEKTHPPRPKKSELSLQQDIRQVSVR